ncbi:DapH/DapD/GlmU-related protein [Streptomyces sp. NPDC001941]|uniref:acyltransferase n=1 Tax=Streptomyces sp. NPDC001941 TaxID=3154659 RepID=UPI00332A24A2
MGDLFQGSSWLRHGTIVDRSTVGSRTFTGFHVVLRYADVGSGAQIAARAQLLGTAARRVTVGDGAWIGAGARIHPGVRIGEHAIVGAGSDVHEDVPAHTISYGRPATARATVTTRFDQGDGIEGVLALVRKRQERDTTRLAPDRPADPEAFFDCAADLGQDVSVGRAAVVIGRPDGPSPQGGVSVGDRTRLGDHLVAEGGGGLTIGPDVTLAEWVTVTTSTHDHRTAGRPWTAAPVHIAAGASIGAGATLVGPLRIGAGATIAPGAVVTRDVAPGEHSKGVFG